MSSVILGKNAIDLQGKTFGMLRVLEAVGRSSDGKILWLCVCECGSQTVTRGTMLLRGRVRSCGHLRVRLTHGHARRGGGHSPEYAAWAHMIDRCTNPKARNWGNYGGRGITVCDRWRQSFESFLADMGPRPSNRHSLERRNNDGSYEPENCAWATPREQLNNKRTNRLLTFKGQTRSIAEWSRETGIPYYSLYGRVYCNWPAERALTQPVLPRKRR